MIARADGADALIEPAMHWVDARVNVLRESHSRGYCLGANHCL